MRAPSLLYPAQTSRTLLVKLRKRYVKSLSYNVAHTQSWSLVLGLRSEGLLKRHYAFSRWGQEHDPVAGGKRSTPSPRLNRLFILGSFSHSGIPGEMCRLRNRHVVTTRGDRVRVRVQRDLAVLWVDVLVQQRPHNTEALLNTWDPNTRLPYRNSGTTQRAHDHDCGL